MAKSIAEYAAWLDERNLRWPAPPKAIPVTATPYVKPLDDVKGVAWDVYGTLLRVSEGELLFQHPQQVRMEVALDKTLQEFNLWNIMSRKPGAPWEYLQSLYLRAYDDLRLAGSGRKGDLTEVNSAKLWRRVLGKMELDKLTYDTSLYGDLDQYSEKIAFFFHTSLQGSEAAPGACEALRMVQGAGLRQGLIADAQCFTVAQLLRGLEAQGKLPLEQPLLETTVTTLSCEEGVRKPSKSLYLTAAERFRSQGVAPEQVLYISARLRDDLAIAKSVGFRTALYAGDKVSLKASGSDLKDPTVKPDRLLTDVTQIRDILSL